MKITITKDAWMAFCETIAESVGHAEEGERLWKRIRAEPSVEAGYRAQTKEGIERRADFHAGEARAYRHVLKQLNKIVRTE